MTTYKRVGILSALPVESGIILDGITDKTEYIHAGMLYTAGRLEDHDVVLSNCGVSKVNAAMFTQIMIDRFHPDCIMFTGVAGSMNKEVKHTDLVIADELTFFDVNPKQLENCFPNTVRFRTDDELNEMIISKAEDCDKGLIITGDRFIHSREDKDGLLKAFPEALAVEMEGCAVAQVCQLNGIPLTVLRCITDLADNDAEDSYKEFERTAAEKSAEIIIKAIKDLR